MSLKTFLGCVLIVALWLGGCVQHPSPSIIPTPTRQQLEIKISTETSALSLSSTQLLETDTPSPTLEIPTLIPTEIPFVRFAVIGDYGSGDQNAGDVAALVNSWDVDFIITTGDNNYPLGQESTIDHRIGQFYHQYIFPYQGKYGIGSEKNRFFPTLGNHDWMTAGAQPYLDYFTLPGNERYYDFTWGHVHLFALDSDSNEPDGVGRSSIQASWLRDTLAASTSTWKIVYMHQPPYSSGYHGSIEWARWPYKGWGADAVLGGHDHTYERLILDGLPYFVNGLGGGEIYYFKSILDGSKKRFNDDYGAMLVQATPDQLQFQFITRKGLLVDDFVIFKENRP